MIVAETLEQARPRIGVRPDRWPRRAVFDALARAAACLLLISAAAEPSAAGAAPPHPGMLAVVGGPVVKSKGSVGGPNTAHAGTIGGGSHATGAPGVFGPKTAPPTPPSSPGQRGG
jgi:hypothetical protein